MLRSSVCIKVCLAWLYLVVVLLGHNLRVVYVLSCVSLLLGMCDVPVFVVRTCVGCFGLWGEFLGAE